MAPLKLILNGYATGKYNIVMVKRCIFLCFQKLKYRSGQVPRWQTSTWFWSAVTILIQFFKNIASKHLYKSICPHLSKNLHIQIFNSLKCTEIYRRDTKSTLKFFADILVLWSSHLRKNSFVKLCPSILELKRLIRFQLIAKLLVISWDLF